jgi:coenzyme F420-reducing hydrogenase delta subunit
VAYVADLLEEVGLGRERIRMVNMSSAMAVQFAEAVQEMTEAIRELGPNPLRAERQSQ